MVKFSSRETVDKSVSYGNSADRRKGEPGFDLSRAANLRGARRRDETNMVNAPATPKTATQAVRSGFGPHRGQRSSVPPAASRQRPLGLLKLTGPAAIARAQVRSLSVRQGETIHARLSHPET